MVIAVELASSDDDRSRNSPFAAVRHRVSALDSVNDRVRQPLRISVLSQEQVAKALALSTATLRRKLANEGTSFREISRQIRQQRLVALLADGEPLDDFAVEVGLSDRRSLSRTCTSWLGVSPSLYRSQHRSTSSMFLELK